MSQPTLKERVAALEKEVADLKAALATVPELGGWQSTVGMFAGDEVMKEIAEEGRKWRESERRKAQRRPRKRPAKS